MQVRPIFTTYKYIMRETFYPFVMGVAMSTFVLLMFQILRVAELMIVQGVDFFVIVKLLYYMIVSFFPITIPISFLFSVLMVFNRLSSDSEIIALKASGISIYQLMVPVLFIAFLAGFATLYVSFKDGPWGNRNAMNLVYKIGLSKASAQIKEGYFNEDFAKGVMIYADKVDEKDNIMKDVFIVDERDEEMPVALTAKKSRLEMDEKTKKTTLTLYDGFMNFLVTQGEKYKRATFATYRMILFEGEYIQDRNPVPPSLSLQELKEHRIMALQSGDKSYYNKITVELHRRFAVPFACIIFAFLGVGFGNTNKRNVKMGAGVISFSTMLMYWFIYIGATAMGTKGTIDPFLSAWLANIVFMIISAHLIFSKE